MTDAAPRKNWHNLLKKLCPECGTPLATSGIYLVCPGKMQIIPKDCMFSIRSSKFKEVVKNLKSAKRRGYGQS